jgi:hypothetical protein
MDMVKVVNPTLNEYMERVRFFATRYLGDANKWYELNVSQLDNMDDRDEFTFIRMALWDKLMDMEFFAFSSPPGQVPLFSQCGASEPGTIPGSFIFGGDYWALTNTQSLLTAF